MILRLAVVAGSITVLMLTLPAVNKLAAGSCWADNRYNGDVMCSWTECDWDGDGFSDASHFNGCFERDENGDWVPIVHPGG